jgi:uncharacterized protein HemX
MAIPPKPVKHKSGAPIAAIIVAILVALGLVGVTVYAYMQSNKKTPATTTTTQQTTDKATTQDVDQASKDVDDSLKSLDANKDFPESDLSDQSLKL